MLIIINEGRYDKFTRSKISKPSEYCIQNLKLGKQIKRRGFIRNYFSDVDGLIEVLKKYHQIRQNTSEDTVYSLLR